jgi:uncharacterized protein YpiB (UPF0302 family)
MSTPIIHTYEKKAFIYWFLNQYQLKVRESNWILTYLVSNNRLLRNVHFVRDAHVCPRSIVMTSSCIEGAAFRFYRNQLVTSDPEKAFHDIRLNRDEPLYIELRFPHWEKSPQYALILEENPYLRDEDFITDEDIKEAENLMNFVLKKQRKKVLQQEIDKALDEKDLDRFLKLTEELETLL